MCFKACSAQSGHGVRYTTNWMFECILIEIKGPALYQKLCREKILRLPSTVTLQRYIKKLKPAYGFHTSTFKCLKKNLKISKEQSVMVILSHKKLNVKKK